MICLIIASFAFIMEVALYIYRKEVVAAFRELKRLDSLLQLGEKIYPSLFKESFKLSFFQNFIDSASSNLPLKLTS
jgi:hypothetical protein